MNKDYYVYFHRNSFNNDIFYVGKGRNRRCFDGYNKRSMGWKTYIDDNKCSFIIEKVCCNLTDNEAKELEKFYLKSIPSLVNFKIDNSWNSNLLDVIKHFKYSESSPTFLLWEKPLKYSNKKKNDIAGSFDKGYVKITFNFKQYLAYRLIWVMFNNAEIPDGMVINHKDCNPSNNSIENLECISFCENNRKKTHNISNTPSSSNKSGVNGVRLATTQPNGKDGKSYASWSANIYFKDKNKKKSFSIIKYGYDEAYRLACEWRKQMEDLYYNKVE